MSDEQTSHIMYIQEQVLRFAAAIGHKHNTNDIEGLSNEYAPKKHDSDSNTYGVGTKNKYGHVKVDESTSTESTNPVQNKVITKYINDTKTELQTFITNLSNKINQYSIVETIDTSSTNTQLPTAKAVYNAIKAYKDFKGIDLANPLLVDQDIDDIVNAGYYKQLGNRNFSYGGETIYYKDGLIKVERQANRIIQHVYSTSKITSGNETTYKINGSQYTRWGAMSNGKMIWNSWEVAYKPYTKTLRACKFGPGVQNIVDNAPVKVFENTSGFIIHWDQADGNDDRYPITANLYEYATVCKFEPPLPITGPYVFGNLIGRFDIKIDADKMQIRSNVNKGGRIIEMHECYFVPRNQ